MSEEIKWTSEEFGKEYCRYCGRDIENVHAENCPVETGLPSEGETIAYGIESTGNLFQDLQTGRLRVLIPLCESEGDKIVLKENKPKIAGRLVLEHVKDELKNLEAFFEGKSGFLDSVIRRSKIKKRKKGKKGFDNLQTWLIKWENELGDRKYYKKANKLIKSFEEENL